MGSSGQHNVKIGSFCVQNDQILFESFQRFLGLIIYDFINTICYYGGGGQCVCILKLCTYSVREEYSTWVQTCCTLIYEGGTLFQRRPCLSQTFVINRCSTLWGLQLNWLRFIHERRLGRGNMLHWWEIIESSFN